MMHPITEASADKLGVGLRDQVIIVTGASGGLGRGIVRSLAQLGASVGIIFKSHPDSAKQAVDEVRSLGGRAFSRAADVRDIDEVLQCVEATRRELGEVTGVVNNAGVVRDRALMLMDPSDWSEVIDTNLTGVFNVCRACIISMMKQKRGRIVNIGSVAGVRGSPRQVNYSASKAGVAGLTASLAKEVAGYGITVNCVAPGYISAGMLERLSQRQLVEIEQRIPVGRLGTVEEVAGVVGYLLSDAASYITGQTFIIDGGLSL